MLNSQAFYNSRPDGFGVLEVADNPSEPDAPRKFVPLMRTALTGTVTGPLATLTLAQTFALPDQSTDVLEALYRFPLPGDAAVTGVRVRFGDVEIHTTLKERETAETVYREVKREGRQAALVTRESPDVFTLAVAGIRPGQDIAVQTDYVQVAKAEGAGWSLRVPLTTAPRYVRADEASSRHADGQPLAVLRDPGHRFALDLVVREAERIACSTHALAVEGDRVRLREGEVIPDRDCVISWGAKADDSQPALRTWVHTDPATEKAYFLALCAPPKFANAKKIPREVVLLVDHSGSMRGAKWEAADWAVERFLAGLSEHDSFALGLFHSTTKWFAERPRKATPDAMREAVAFLKANHDSGGTELGVALEQALDRARVADTPSRHVLILTDAEVSDAGRVLRLADLESEKPNRRRVSVLCIDAAPNAALASELAERGGGVARFLTSNPDEDDVTTALDEVLADWSAPVLTGLTLEVNRVRAEATGRTVALVVPGPASAVDIGDLPAGRPVWVVGRVPLDGEPLSFRLRTGADVIAESRSDAGSATSGLKALFGADRVRRLEYVMTGGTSGDKLRTELGRLGYDAVDVGEEKVFAENAHEASAKAVRELLVRESLAAGVPSSETAFIAVRTEAGQPVTGTVAVANGLPEERLEAQFGSGAAVVCGAASMSALQTSPSVLSRPPAPAPVGARRARKIASPPPSGPGGGAGVSVKLTPEMIDRLRQASVRGQWASLNEIAPPSRDVRISVSALQHTPADGAALYDSATGTEGQLTFLAVMFGDSALTADQLDPELTLLLFVGDLASPRARVKLADVLRQGGRRPLNVRRAANQPVRLTLEDPSGAWASGVPALEIVLGWKD